MLSTGLCIGVVAGIVGQIVVNAFLRWRRDMRDLRNANAELEAIERQVEARINEIHGTNGDETA